MSRRQAFAFSILPHPPHRKAGDRGGSAIYLITAGLIGIFGISLGQLSILMPILALAAGVMILIGR